MIVGDMQAWMVGLVVNIVEDGDLDLEKHEQLFVDSFIKPSKPDVHIGKQDEYRGAEFDAPIYISTRKYKRCATWEPSKEEGAPREPATV